MTVPIQLAANAVVARIMNPDRAVKTIVSELLSYRVEGAEFAQAFVSGTWDGRSTFFNHQTASFPAGFTNSVHAELVKRGYQVQLIKKPLPAPLGPENPIVDEFGNDDPRYDYQMKALRAIEKHGRGIIQVATGGGKSKIAKLIVSRFRRMTMFITTRGVLMYQMEKGFRSAGYNVGVIGDGTWKPTKGVNVGMVQTLVAQLEEPDLNAEIRAIVKSAVKKDVELTRQQCVEMGTQNYRRKVAIRNRAIKLLEMVEVVIGEEAHEAGGNSYFKILQHCKNAHIRVALTATPFMREGAEDNYRLLAAFGPVLIKVSEKLLIDRGILAKPYFKFVPTAPHPKLRKSSPWQRAYTLGYTENQNLLEDLIADARRAVACGLPVLTLIQRKDHGAAVKKAYAAAGLRVQLIRGENDQDERERALKALSTGKIDVLIGSTIVDVGVDVPSIGLVQLAGGGKAEVAMRQRIGRGLRAKKGVPNVAFIADYGVQGNPHLTDHSRARRAIVEATPGFAEGILPAGTDFPWAIFENARRAA